MALDPRYLKGIEHFNAREFFDAHEVWEDLWHEEHGEANGFVQGLIQYATALHHFEARNLKGAKLLTDAGTELLRPYGETYWDLPVKKLVDDMTECLKEVLARPVAELPGRYHPDKNTFPIRLIDEKVPRINLINRTHG